MNSQTGSVSTDALILDHLPVVHSVLRSLSRTLPSHVDRDDLRSAGYAGLVSAARSFDVARGVAFPAYATRRVRGAMLDELRAQDWATRSVRAAERNRSRTAEALAGQLCREASRNEIAGELGTTVDALRRSEAEVHRSTVVSLQGLVDGIDQVGDDVPSPLDTLIQREGYAYLRDAIQALPSRLRDVIVALYFDERPTQQLALDMGVSAARVSQMCREAVSLLKVGIDACTATESGQTQTRSQGVVARRRAAYCTAVSQRSDWRTRLSASQVA